MTLYITSVSFEDRCLALLRDLAQEEERGEERHIAVLDFRGYEAVDPYLVNRAQFMRDAAEIGCGVDVVDAAPSCPLEGRARLEEIVKEVGARRVVVDISTLPRNHLFGICRLLCEAGGSTTLRYYKPEAYGGQLSRGVRRVEPMPGFEGKGVGDGSLTLVLILGFEGYKSLYAWEQLGPSRTIALLGDPPYRAEFLDMARRRNGELFRQMGGRGEVGRLHTFDVGVAYGELEGLYRRLVDEDPGVEIAVCPLGTKPQTVAAFALGYNHLDVGVAYVSSLMYYTGDYSRGFVREYVEVSLDALVGREGKAVGVGGGAGGGAG